jgi:hypothetical protein
MPEPVGLQTDEPEAGIQVSLRTDPEKGSACTAVDTGIVIPHHTGDAPLKTDKGRRAASVRTFYIALGIVLDESLIMLNVFGLKLHGPVAMDHRDEFYASHPHLRNCLKDLFRISSTTKHGCHAEPIRQPLCQADDSSRYSGEGRLATWCHTPGVVNGLRTVKAYLDMPP